MVLPPVNHAFFIAGPTPFTDACLLCRPSAPRAQGGSRTQQMLSKYCEVSHLLHHSRGADGGVRPTEGCSGLRWSSVTVSSLGLSLYHPWPHLHTPPPHSALIRVLPLNAPWNICKLGWAWEAGRGLLPSPAGAGSLSPRQLWLFGPDCSALSPSLGKALLAPVWHSCPSLAKGLSL